MNKTAYELLKMIVEVKEILPLVVSPFLCIHGDADQVSLLEGNVNIHHPTAMRLPWDTAW
jgi:hypothetical protein